MIRIFLLQFAILLFTETLCSQELQQTFNEIKTWEKNITNLKQSEVFKNADSIKETFISESNIKRIFFKGVRSCDDSVSMKYTFVFCNYFSQKENSIVGVLKFKTNNTIKVKKIQDSLNAAQRISHIYFDSITVSPEETLGSFTVTAYFILHSQATQDLFSKLCCKELKKYVKEEYHEACFVSKQLMNTSWPYENLCIRFPRTDVLDSMLRKKCLNDIFLIMTSKNDCIRWGFAEGLFYYNSKHPILNNKQKILIEKYNGKDGFPKFRSFEDLSKVYPTW